KARGEYGSPVSQCLSGQLSAFWKCQAGWKKCAAWRRRVFRSMATWVHFCGGECRRLNGEENKVSTPTGKQIPGFIEPDQWQNFLDGFSKRNQGRATRL